MNLTLSVILGLLVLTLSFAVILSFFSTTPIQPNEIQVLAIIALVLAVATSVAWALIRRKGKSQ